jgi:hypothetical protein
MQKHKTMFRRNPAMYVKAIAADKAQGATTSGFLISSATWAMAS